MATGSTAGVRAFVPPPVIPKPNINWTQLSSPLETTTNKVSRNFGKGLIVVGVLSGVGRQLAAARMTASPDTIIRTCYTLQVVMIVSLVAGAVLWFFNRLSGDPSLLLQQRQEVGDQIEKTPLVDLRKTYQSAFILSDSELNLWIRYLAQSSPFNVFMTTQSERIFILPLEQDTTKLLKALYLDYVDKTQIPFKTLIAQKPFQELLSDAEQKSLQSFVANREAAKGVVCNAASYREFIGNQGVEILSHLKPENLQSLVQGFYADAVERGVGILGLKANRAAELKAFGTDTETALFQQVANREGLKSYETFKTRNGGEAVVYITIPAVKELLFGSFSDFVVARDQGLVETRDNFGTAIARFGEGADQKIYSRVLNNEIDALGRAARTYLEFRRRNGIGVIEFNTLGNFDLIHFFKACFLRLPASDLIHPDYAVDRNLFGITIEEVRAGLWGRWNGMTFAGILQTDRDGFVAAVTGANRCFDPRDWTPKAVQETAVMSIKDIISAYRVFFTTGVLTANDGNMRDRLAGEITAITAWTTLIDTYGAFVFEQRLLVSTQVEHLVKGFINTYAESYLNESFEGAMSKYVEAIKNFCMNSVLTQKIKAAKAAIAAEKQRYADWLKGHETDFKRRIQARNDTAEREVAQLKSDYRISEKEREKTAAHRAWSETQAAYQALAQGMKTCEEEIQRDRETYAQKCGALEELRRTQTGNSVNVQLYRIQAERAAGQAKYDLQQAEALMQRHPQKEQLAGFQKEERGLQSRLQEIEDKQREYDMLSEEVNKPAFAQRKKVLEEMINHPDKPVTGLKAAEEAKKAVKEAPNTFSSNESQRRQACRIDKRVITN